MNGTTRAGAILAFLGGLVGAGAAGRRLARGHETLVLLARDPSPPRRPPAPGERLTLVAELLDPRGEPVGELIGAGFALSGPGERWSDAADRLELHTFRLPGGTIVGTGASPLGEGELAIVGGTGRYAGARGTYTARARDGGTEYVLELRS